MTDFVGLMQSPSHLKARNNRHPKRRNPDYSGRCLGSVDKVPHVLPQCNLQKFSRRRIRLLELRGRNRSPHQGGLIEFALYARVSSSPCIRSYQTHTLGTQCLK